MSARMSQRRIDDGRAKIIVELSSSRKIFFVAEEQYKKFEPILEKYSEDENASISWNILAKDRLEKYKRAGLVLRGMRYRESMSQKLLAEKSGVSQNEISNIENGKRTVGEKVAKRLAKVLSFDYKMLLE